MVQQIVPQLTPWDVAQGAIAPFANAVQRAGDRGYETAQMITKEKLAERLQQLRLDAVAKNVADRDKARIQIAQQQDAARIQAQAISEKRSSDAAQMKGIYDASKQEILTGKNYGTDFTSIPIPKNADGSPPTPAQMADWTSAARAANQAKRATLLGQATKFYTGYYDGQAAITDKLNSLLPGSLKQAQSDVQNQNPPTAWALNNLDQATAQKISTSQDPIGTMKALGVFQQYADDLQSKIPAQQAVIVAKQNPVEAGALQMQLKQLDDWMKIYQGRNGGADYDHEANVNGYQAHVQNQGAQNQQRITDSLNKIASGAGIKTSDGTQITSPDQLLQIANGRGLKNPDGSPLVSVDQIAPAYTAQQTALTAAIARRNAAVTQSTANANDLSRIGLVGKFEQSGAGSGFAQIGHGFESIFMPGSQPNRFLTSGDTWKNVGESLAIPTRNLFVGDPAASPPTDAELAARRLQLGLRAMHAPVVSQPNGGVPVITNGVPTALATPQTNANPAAASGSVPLANLIPSLPVGNDSTYDRALSMIPNITVPPPMQQQGQSAVDAELEAQRQNNNSPYNPLYINQ